MKKQWMMLVLVLACMLMVTACTNKNANSSVTSSMGMQDEFAEGHIPNAVLLSQTEISEKAEMVLNDKEKTILLYCRTGNRSETAAKQLIDMGYTHIYDFGGIDTWTGELVTDDGMDVGKDMMDKPDNTKASMNK